MVLSAQTPSKGQLLVLSKGEHTLSIVDVDTKRVIARMPTGPDPHEVVASTDGKSAYVSNYGGGAFNTLALIDLVNRKTLTAIDLGALRGPHGLVFADGKVWFTAEAAKAIGRFDPAIQRVDWIMGTGQDRTHMLYVTSDFKHIYTTNVNSATVTLMEQRFATERRPPGPAPSGGSPAGGPPPGGPRLEWEETVVPVGKGAEGFDVAPDGKELWAANAQDGTISVIDISAKKVTQTLDANVMGANRLKFTPDGKHVLVASLNGQDLTVLDAKTKSVVKRIAVGKGAAGIQMEPDGARAFVACTPNDYIAVIDLKTMEVTGHLNAGREPDGLAWVGN